MFTLSTIRSLFLNYFRDLGHTVVPSSSLVPDNDPTLLFTNAGMVQFKDVFVGAKRLPFSRATTSQKCLRAGGKHNDLENVGYTSRHHTFFEMLGNFSFGDYFKDNAIEFAWNLVTKELGLPKDRLLVTVHSSDEEAASIWKKVAGFSDSDIIRIPTSDNFWSMGSTGPCGPCTEIFYDHGEGIPGGRPGTPEQDGDRFVEIWNLVFMQFEALENGDMVALPNPSIDTGMGIERIAAILQGVHSNFDIDVFRTIISDTEELVGAGKARQHYNVIADHIRAITFMISDGIVPSNEWRGYVLRRIIRRALRHGYMIGMKEPFLYKLVDSVNKTMGPHYADIGRNLQMIKQVLHNEEESFMRTIDKGMEILKSEIISVGDSEIFPAKTAYKLYDTFGFPIDLTQDILKAENKKINEDEFNSIVEENKEKSKKAWAGSGDVALNQVWKDISNQISNQTEFVRDEIYLDTQILFLVKDDLGTLEIVDELNQGESGYVITKETPFYFECGGQIGDLGKIKHNEDNIADVLDTLKYDSVIAHKVIVTNGTLSSKDEVLMSVDKQFRLDSSRNHTATHILHQVLKEVLGAHVSQKGSYVSNDRLRFDFMHNGSIDKYQLEEIERLVNKAIDDNMPVNCELMQIDDAIQMGACALFGEKYSDNVRVVFIGDGYSKELCGGTHVSHTLLIKSFKITASSSTGSGLRRIEAVTGDYVKTYFENEIEILQNAAEQNKAKIKELQKEIRSKKDESAIDEIKFEKKSKEGVDIIIGTSYDLNNKTMLKVADDYKEISKTALLLANKSSKNGKYFIILSVSKDLLPDMSAEKIISKAIEHGVNIKFAGREDLAQTGGLNEEDIQKLRAILI